MIKVLLSFIPSEPTQSIEVSLFISFPEISYVCGKVRYIQYEDEIFGVIGTNAVQDLVNDISVITREIESAEPLDIDVKDNCLLLIRKSDGEVVGKIEGEMAHCYRN